MKRPLDDREGRQQAAREYVELDPVGPSPLPLVGDVRIRDCLQAQAAARLKRLVASLKEGLVVLGAHGLEHLDRHDGVVGPLDLAVVAQLDVHESLQAGSPDPLDREVPLGFGDRDRRHAAAQLSCGVDREATPSTADLQDVHPGSQAGTFCHQAVLVPLGVGKGLLRRLEHGR